MSTAFDSWPFNMGPTEGWAFLYLLLAGGVMWISSSVTGKIAQIYEINEPLTEDIKLAVDEACTNVIKHAYRGDRTKKIVLKYKVTEKPFKVIIEDTGIKARTRFNKR